MAATQDVLMLFALLGGSLFAGYAGNWLFRRHRVSDIAFLLGVGILAGPVLGAIDVRPFAPAFAALAPMALAIVLFEGGLELAWSDLRRHAASAFRTSIAVWLLSVLFVTVSARGVLGLPWHLALLFALAVAATGILAVIPLLSEMRVAGAARVILTVETSLGDLLSVVAVTAMAGILVSGASPWDGALLFGGDVLVGASVGILVGLVGARILHSIEGQRNGYALVLAFILGGYAVAEVLGGSGFLAALFLGLFMGNAKVLMRHGGIERLAPPADAMRLQQNHIIFLLRSVYFVYLGAGLSREILTPSFLLAGAGLTVAMVAARAIAVTLSRVSERGLIVSMMPRGLATAVLAGLPVAMGVPGTEAFVGYACLLIVGADIATTAGLWLTTRRPKPAAPPAVEPAEAPH